MNGRELLYTLVRLYRDSLYLYHQKLQTEFKDIGISLLQAKIIHLLKGEGPQSLSEVSKKLGMPNSSLSEIVDRLEERGLLYRERDRKDRRIVWIHLSQKCESFLQTLEDKEVRRLEQLWPKDQMDGDIRLLAEMLQRFVEILTSLKQDENS
ncbi:MarR family winged helix-turn-helix transcriptional regulator [Laceyella putida]|uniref:MarR family winged helix-turn-helix transcriptional regulator n=1 Tax=Laceyella putida TaxID=110101 RepID=A0ABW2RGZ1_9BACL